MWDKGTRCKTFELTQASLRTEYIGCVNIQETRVTANKSTTNNVQFFFASDFKIVYNNNY